jgi:flagellar assembly protein FliH
MIADAAQRSALTLTSAREEAAEILEAARAESAALRERAAEEGYKDGLDKGYEEALAKVEGLISQAEATLQLAGQAYDSMLQEAEPRVLALALSTAKRIASDSLRCEPEVALDLIRKGMTALRDEREFSLHCDPALVSILEGAKDDLGREFGARSIEVMPDSSACDGARVVTPHGFVDVTVASQLKNLTLALAEARKRTVGGEQ